MDQEHQPKTWYPELMEEKVRSSSAQERTFRLTVSEPHENKVSVRQRTLSFKHKDILHNRKNFLNHTSERGVVTRI